ncbi:unnamed protein product [Closterium sp. NIES-53]
MQCSVKVGGLNLLYALQIRTLSITGGIAGVAGGTGGDGTGGAGTTGAGATGASGPGGARTRGTGAVGAGGAAGAGGVRGAAGGAGGTRAACTGGTSATSAGAAGAAGPGSARTRGARAARAGGAGGATGAAGTGAAGAGGTGAGGTGGTRAAGTGGAVAPDAGAAGPGSACTRGTRAIGAGGAVGARGATRAASTRGAGAASAGGAGDTAGTGGAGAGGTGGTGAADGTGTAPRLPFFYLQAQSSLPPPDLALRQVLSLPSSTGLTPPLMCPLINHSQPQLLPGSPLPAPTHTEVTESLTERREPETRASTPVHARRVARPRPRPVLSTHGMALRPSSVPQHVVLPEPPASSLSHVPDLESDLAHAASPTLVHLAARIRLDYVACLVTVSEYVCPPSVGGEPAIGSDVLEERQFELECLMVILPRFASMLLCPEGDSNAPDIPTPRSYAEAIASEYSSQWQTAMGAEMASWKSTGTYVDEVPPPGANIVNDTWIFRVKRPPGSPPAFKARYIARGFSQQQGVDFFQNFSPTPKMTTLRVLLRVAAQRDYELHSLVFSTAFLQGTLHEEIWLCRPPGFTRSFPAGTQWSLQRPV